MFIMNSKNKPMETTASKSKGMKRPRIKKNPTWSFSISDRYQDITTIYCFKGSQ